MLAPDAILSWADDPKTTKGKAVMAMNVKQLIDRIRQEDDNEEDEETASDSHINNNNTN